MQEEVIETLTRAVKFANLSNREQRDLIMKLKDLDFREFAVAILENLATAGYSIVKKDAHT